MDVSQISVLTPGRGWSILEIVIPRLLREMSEEQLKAFQEAVKADVGLQEKLKAAGDADAVVAVAKAAGFVISPDELKKAQEVFGLTDKELEWGISGGRGTRVMTLQCDGPDCVKKY
jgi:predicted ribosomally synthesized peptide with nif11-like leader